MSFCLHNSQVCNLCRSNQCHTTLVDQGSALGYISMCAASKAPGQKAAVLTTTIIPHQCSNWATLVKIPNRNQLYFLVTCQQPFLHKDLKGCPSCGPGDF